MSREQVIAINGDVAATRKALDALDALSEQWAEEVNLRGMAENIARQGDVAKAAHALALLAWVEGAYAGRTSLQHSPPKPAAEQGSDHFVDVNKMVVYRLRQCVAGGPLAYDAIAIDEAADMLTAFARLSTPAAEQGDAAPFAIVGGEEFAGPQDLCFAYRQLQARNAEMAEQLKFYHLCMNTRACDELRADAYAASQKLSTLTAGIAGLEQKWRVTNHQIGQGSAGNKARRQCADDLKAFREGVSNGC